MRLNGRQIMLKRAFDLLAASAGLILTDAPDIKALEFALAIIAIGATITTIQRILHVRSQAKQQSIQTQ